MQNENAGKTVEQPIWREIEVNLYRSGYIAGYTIVQQSQPMWREIEGDKMYFDTMAKRGSECCVKSARGRTLLNLGYTHYLSSKDLLRLPVETTKTTPQERG